MIKSLFRTCLFITNADTAYHSPQDWISVPGPFCSGLPRCWRTCSLPQKARRFASCFLRRLTGLLQCFKYSDFYLSSFLIFTDCLFHQLRWWMALISITLIYTNTTHKCNSKSTLPLEPIGIPLVLGYTYLCYVLTKGHCWTRTAIEEMGRRLLEPFAWLLALAPRLPIHYISNLS